MLYYGESLELNLDDDKHPHPPGTISRYEYTIYGPRIIYTLIQVKPYLNAWIHAYMKLYTHVCIQWVYLITDLHAYVSNVRQSWAIYFTFILRLFAYIDSDLRVEPPNSRGAGLLVVSVVFRVLEHSSLLRNGKLSSFISWYLSFLTFSSS